MNKLLAALLTSFIAATAYAQVGTGSTNNATEAKVEKAEAKADEKAAKADAKADKKVAKANADAKKAKAKAKADAAEDKADAVK